jgi:hypothetical protein
MDTPKNARLTYLRRLEMVQDHRQPGSAPSRALRTVRHELASTQITPAAAWVNNSTNREASG